MLDLDLVLVPLTPAPRDSQLTPIYAPLDVVGLFHTF